MEKRVRFGNPCFAAPPELDREGNGLDLEEAVTAGPGGMPIVSRMSRIVVTARSSIRRF